MPHPRHWVLPKKTGLPQRQLKAREVIGWEGLAEGGIETGGATTADEVEATASRNDGHA